MDTQTKALHTFQFATGRIRYKVSGHGPLLILLHGFGGNDQDWAECALAFESYFTVVVPSMLSLYMPTEDPLTFRKQVEVMGGFIAEVRARFAELTRQNNGMYVSRDPAGTERVFLAGTSYGGAVSWGVTVLFPNLVHRLILVNSMPPDPAAHFQSRGLRLLIKLARVPAALPYLLHSQFGLQLLKQVEVLFQVPWVQHTRRAKLAKWTDRKARVVSFALARFSSMARREAWQFWSDQISKIEQPVLIINSSHDALFSKESLAQWQNNFVTKVTCILQGSHMVTRDEPEFIAETIVEFSQSEFVLKNKLSKTSAESVDQKCG